MEVERVEVAGTDSNNSLLKLSWKELPAIFSLISFNLNRQINIMGSGIYGYSLFDILIVLIISYF